MQNIKYIVLAILTVQFSSAYIHYVLQPSLPSALFILNSIH